MTNGTNDQDGNGFADRVGRTVREIREDLAGRHGNDQRLGENLDENDGESLGERADETFTEFDHEIDSDGVADAVAYNLNDELVEVEVVDDPVEEIVVEEPQMLADEDERLPWLESDDDYDEGGFDLNRLLVVGLIAAVTLGGLLGLIWFFSQPGADQELLAEGSTIEAPDTPYRTSPDDAGGTQVAGTGDASFEVGEGQSRESQLAGDADSAAPSIDRSQVGSSAEGTTTTAAGTAGATAAAGTDTGTNSATTTAGRVAIQVAAYSSRARAEQGWSDLANRYDALQGLSHRIEEASIDGATVYRLQALASTAANADTVCRSLRAAGGDCQVKR